MGQEHGNNKKISSLTQAQALRRRYDTHDRFGNSTAVYRSPRARVVKATSVLQDNALHITRPLWYLQPMRTTIFKILHLPAANSCKTTLKKKKGHKHTDADNFTLTYMHTKHMGSRWYTADLHVVTTNIYASVPTVAPRLGSLRRKNRRKLSVARMVAACFVLASVANCLQARCFLCAPNRWTGYGATADSLWTSLLSRSFTLRFSSLKDS